MNKTIVNKCIMFIIVKNNYAYELNLNDISELKITLNSIIHQN